MFKKVAAVVVIIAVIIALVIGNTINYRNSENYKQLLEAESGSEATESYPTPIESTPAGEGVISSSMQPDSTSEPLDDSTEEDIRAVSETFLQAYFEHNSALDADEYTHSFDGLLTENGLQNLGELLERPDKIKQDVQLQRELCQCDAYIRTGDAKNATALCTAYVRQIMTIRGQEPATTYDPILIRLELKKTKISEWRINSISFERSMATLPFDAAELFG